MVYDPYPWNAIDGHLQAQGLLVVDQVIPLLELDAGFALAPALADFDSVSRLSAIRQECATAHVLFCGFVCVCVCVCVCVRSSVFGFVRL